jgi:hypothetical protein
VNDSPDDDVDESMAYESDPDISALDAHMTQLVQEKMKSSEGKENVRRLLLLCGYFLGPPANSCAASKRLWCCHDCHLRELHGVFAMTTSNAVWLTSSSATHT